MNVYSRIRRATILLLTLTTITQAQQTFNLRGVRSTEDYGPFTFQTGTMIKLESGVFKLNIMNDGRAFSLLDTHTGLSYGVYELVLGRMIDIGEVLFTITRINRPEVQTAPTVQDTKESIFDNTAFAVQMTLLHETAYDWEINGATGGDHVVKRNGVSVKARKGIVFIALGLITSAEWDHTIAGDGDVFENAQMVDGTGFAGSIGIRVPVFQEGRWSGIVEGHAAYRIEDLSLQYGAWELESITTVTDTNAVTNAVTVTENRSYNNIENSATLSETIISLGIELAYNAPVFSFYGGLRALPWVDTSLDAVIRSDDNRYDITFDRKDPVMAYGGIGLTFMNVTTTLEIEGGGQTAIRLGLSRAF